MNTRRIYVVGGDNEYAKWMEGKVVSFMTDANLVLFTGGADVSPGLYGERKHPKTMNNPGRDIEELKCYLAACELGLHMIGICRGAQFLCAMAGGKLIQHQENKGSHKITAIHSGDNADTEFELEVAADHHQAQFPWLLPANDYTILAYTQGLSPFHQGGSGEEMEPDDDLEVEDVYYPKIKALAIQCHPEWMPLDSPAVAHYRKLLDMHMRDELGWLDD